MALVLDGSAGISGVDGTASNPSYEGTDSNTGIFYPAADTVAIGTGGTERLRVDSAGNAGLGVTPSAWGGGFKVFELVGGSLSSGASTNLVMMQNAYYDGTNYIYKTTSTASRYWQVGGAHVWFNAPSGTAGNTITFTQAMTLDASGNLGVGTTSPSTFGQLAVYGNGTAPVIANFLGSNSPATNATYGDIAFGSRTDGTVTARIRGFANDNGNGTDGQLSFWTADNTAGAGALTERARITSGGALWVGNTTDGSPAGNARIISYRNTAGNSFFAHQDVATNDTTAVIRQSVSGGNGGQNIGLLVQIEAASNTDRIICGQYWNAGTPQDRFLAFRNGDMQISGAVATKSTGTTWANPSDIRLKDNVRDYEKGLAELMQVRVREWEYNGKGGTTEGTHGLGVVADEVMLVLPRTVDEFEAKLNENDEEKTKLKRFDATEITWLLVKSIQELKAELDATKAELNALKGNA